MTAEPDLLPLPEPHWIGMDTWDLSGPRHYIADQMQAYARANVAHATAPLQAEIEALRAEVERLRALAGCAYQMAGMHDAPLVWLDRLSEAANGDALPDADTLMDELLPYQPDAVCEAEARAERLAEALRWAERHCPCGARPESPDTHPHLPGCLVGAALAQEDRND